MSEPLNELSEFGVLEAAALLRARQVSAVELADACLVQIEAVNGGQPSEYGSKETTNAWVRVSPALAAQQARAADRRLAVEGDDAPLLCGVPIMATPTTTRSPT